MNVKLTAEQKKYRVGAEGIAEIMQGVLKRENRLSRVQEHFWIVGLDDNYRILFVELLALGERNRLSLKPPETYRMAIYKLATMAVLVHNHPNGNVNPSAADIRATDYMTKAGGFLNINVIDHIIISEADHYSFGHSGLMAEIKASPSWSIVTEEQMAMLKMRGEVEEERIKKENSKEIARKMLAKGVSHEEIKELTGLKLSVINKL